MRSALFGQFTQAVFIPSSAGLELRCHLACDPLHTLLYGLVFKKWQASSQLSAFGELSLGGGRRLAAEMAALWEGNRRRYKLGDRGLQEVYFFWGFFCEVYQDAEDAVFASGC